MEYKLKIAPISEPVSIDDIKNHLRVTHALDDVLIASLIKASRMMVEQITNRQLITATWEAYLDEFPELYVEPIDAIQLFPAPLIAISSINYTDMNGASQVWSTAKWRLDAISEPARLTPAYGQVWPLAREMTNSVKITFTAGYGATEASVPDPLKQAMKLMIGHWYENREEVVIGRISSQLPLASKYLLEPYRVTLFR